MDATTATVPNLTIDPRTDGGETRCENDETEGTRRSISFSTIEITEYPYITGDNPSVSMGVPLTIAWVPLETERYTIDDYEKKRSPRRSRTELIIPPAQRTAMLRGLGFSRNDIQQGSKAANITRNRRRRTAETMNLAPAQEVCEKFTRAMMNATVRRTAKKLERTILGNFRPIHAKGCFPDDTMDKIETSSRFTITTSSESSLIFRKIGG